MKVEIIYNKELSHKQFIVYVTALYYILTL